MAQSMNRGLSKRQRSQTNQQIREFSMKTLTDPFSNFFVIDDTGNLIPIADSAQALGAALAQFLNVYTQAVQASAGLNLAANGGSVAINASGDVTVVVGQNEYHYDAASNLIFSLSRTAGVSYLKLYGIPVLMDGNPSVPGLAAGGLAFYPKAEKLYWKDYTSGVEKLLSMPLVNFAATTDPGAGNDSTQGYDYGSRWLNRTGQKEWVCVDPTATAAVWKQSA